VIITVYESPGHVKPSSHNAAMADVLLENPLNSVPPHKGTPLPADSIPNIDSLEGSSKDGGDEYSTLKRYQRHLE